MAGIDVGVDDIELEALFCKHAILYCHEVALAQLHPLDVALPAQQVNISFPQIKTPTWSA